MQLLRRVNPWLIGAAWAAIPLVIFFVLNKLWAGLGCVIAFSLTACFAYLEWTSRSAQVAADLSESATLALQQGFYGLAAERARRALVFARQARVDRMVLIGRSTLTLAGALQTLAQHEEALAVCRTTLDELRPSLGTTEQDRFRAGVLLQSQSMSLSALGRLAEAAAAAAQAEGYLATLTDILSRLIRAELWCGIYEHQGSVREALTWAANLTAMQSEAVTPEDQALSALTKLNTTNLLARLRQSAAAIPGYLDLLPVFTSRRDFHHVAIIHSNLCLVYGQLGQWQQAVQHGEEVLRLRQRITPPGSPRLGPPQLKLALAYVGTNQPIKAATALATARQLLPNPTLVELGSLLYVQGRVLQAQGDGEGAEQAFLADLRHSDTWQPPSHPDRLDTLLALAEVALASGSTEEAAHWQAQAQAIQQEIAND